MVVIEKESDEYVLIVEIKSLKEQVKMRQAVVENMKQLRNYCVSRNEQKALGLATNGQQWVLTTYDLHRELSGHLAFSFSLPF